MGPSFGGINLEDFKAPEAFDVESELIDKMDIPVFHDDQHGTAIVSSAALLSAVKLTKRDISKIKVTISGAGASALSCANLMILCGVNKNNVLMVDSKGVLHKDRKDLNKYKIPFMVDTKDRTLEDAVRGSDVFLGLSIADILTPKMLLSMNADPIVFALANPNPEIE